MIILLAIALGALAVGLDYFFLPGLIGAGAPSFIASGLILFVLSERGVMRAGALFALLSGLGADLAVSLSGFGLILLWPPVVYLAARKLFLSFFVSTRSPAIGVFIVLSSFLYYATGEVVRSLAYFLAGSSQPVLAGAFGKLAGGALATAFLTLCLLALIRALSRAGRRYFLIR